jgi:hypothetical protein
MKEGILGDIIEYYSTNDIYENDMDRAIFEFFGKSPHEVYEGEELSNDDIYKLLCEWFVFDFKLSNGKPPLVDMCERNPMRWTSDVMNEYNSMRENEYGFFEICSVVSGQVEVESLQYNKKYTVKEFSAVPQLRPRQSIIVRIAHVGDVYEFVSSKIMVFDVEMADGMKRAMRYLYNKNRMTPRDTYDAYYKKKESSDNVNNEQINEPRYVSISQARENLKEVFKRCDILPFVSVRLVEKWLFRDDMDRTLFPTALLFGLISPYATDQDIQMLIQAITDLNNNISHATLSQKTPIEVFSKEKSSGVSSPHFVSNIINSDEWEKFQMKAIAVMKKGDMLQTIKYYELYFSELLKAQSTNREIFRAIANMGATMLAMGNPMGEKILQMALALNPKYDFAKAQLKRFWMGDFDPQIELYMGGENLHCYSDYDEETETMREQYRFIKQKIDEEFKTLSVYQYVQWLRGLGINFSKHKFQKTKLIKQNVSGKKNVLKYFFGNLKSKKDKE